MDDLEQRFDRMRELNCALVYNYLYRYLGDADDASDALSETFRRAHRYLPGFRGECSDRAWLMSIASNVAKRSKLTSGRHRHTSLNALEDQGMAPEACDPANIEHLVLTRQEVDRYLLMLSHDQRSALWMREGLGMTDEEVAAALNVPVGTVKSWVWRALAKLRRTCTQELAGDAI